MTTSTQISFEKIVNALNKNELIDYCLRYQIDVIRIYNSRSLAIYRRNLIKAMVKVHNTEVMSIWSFVNSFTPTLSHDTIINIFPEYDNYVEKKQLENELRKFVKENKEQEANYDNAYIDYYTKPQQSIPSQVNRIEYLTDDEIRRQKNNMIMKSLIEKRKKEDFKRFNKDKINSSPFTDKIDAIYATVEKQLRKLRELEEQQNEWKLSQQRQQE